MSEEYKTTSPNGEVVKTREEMAKQANVSPAKFVLVEKLHRRYLMAIQGGQPSVEAYHTGGRSGCVLLKGMSFCVIPLSASPIALRISLYRLGSGA